MAEIGLRYNFNFAQTGVSVRNSGKNTTLTEYARGSLIYDKKTEYLKFSNQNSVGRGAISIIPYLDLNANGLKDKGEPKAYGLNLHVSSGRVEKSEKDTTLIILGLEPYTNCFIDLDENSFENISWRLPVKILNVAVDPEIVKHIEIPITVVGEASGTVQLEDPQFKGKSGGVIIRFYKDMKLAGSTMSEDDGYYSFFGLEPGNYKVQPDTNQLRKLNLVSEPMYSLFAILPGREGAFVEDIDFTLKPAVPVAQAVELTDTLPPVVMKQEPVIHKDTSVLVVHEVFEELVTISKDSWAIQLGAFKNRSNAENLRRRLEEQLGRKVEIVIADDFFKVRINEIPDRPEVDKIIEVLKKNGISEVWIIGLKAKQQLVVLRERQDSVIKVVETRVEEPEMFESKVFMPMNDVFYKLDRPRGVLVDPTIIKLMKSHSELRKMKFKDIRPNVRIIRSDTVEIRVAGDILADIAVSPETVGEVINPVDFNYPIPGLAAKPVNKIDMETAPKLVKVPKISLQVGVYYKKSEAVRVQKKIRSKLNVPVKIVEQWEYYRVIITGFSSREETYQYYPELAGMGFPGPVLLEE
ncbi:MAG TPA: SPOR domain-containing protein [Bacteroidales bacterium]|nr:SPOR domain-containing protein [Bacteroidales bacterium]